MSHKLIWALAAAGWALAAAPVAVANPQGLDSASTVIDDLARQGYIVQINWVTGLSTVSLSECSVTAVHNPDRSPGGDKSNTTVYVDVTCPDRDYDDSGLRLGGGFGGFGGFGF